MLTLDGSLGEGGGQVLRSALSLSLLTHTPFRLTKIRAGRSRPGLLRQHLTAVEAAASICSADLTGNEPGSQDIAFSPGNVRPGDYHFAVGTAGSATLVLQTILPPLLALAETSRVTIEGGTHNPAAPPFDFLEKTFVPLLHRMGADLRLRLVSHGFFPAGGGRIDVEIHPTPKLSPIAIVNRGAVTATKARALIAHLPSHIASRELEALAATLHWDRGVCNPVLVEDSRGPGNVLIAEVESEALVESFAGFGRKGVSSETVAREVANDVNRYLKAGVPVGRHLADQLLMPMAMARGGIFRTLEPSSHANTQMQTISKFMDITWKVEQAGEDDWVIEVG